MVKISGNIELPDTLYKYRYWTDKRQRRILTKRIAYFSSPADFNDPFDCKIPIRYDIGPERQLEDIYFKTIKAVYKNASDEQIREFSIKHVVEGPVDPSTFKKDDKAYFEDLDQRMGVFSLSKHNDDILMWGHYAKSHKGYCLGFFTQELLKSEGVDYIGKVHYSPEFPVIIPNGDLTFEYEQQIFSKWNKWSYEDEYRLTKNHIENREIELPASAFKEIIFGYQMPEKDQDNVMEIIKHRFPNIEVYQALPHEEKFSLQIERVG